VASWIQGSQTQATMVVYDAFLIQINPSTYSTYKQSFDFRPVVFLEISFDEKSVTHNHPLTHPTTHPVSSI